MVSLFSCTDKNDAVENLDGNNITEDFVQLIIAKDQALKLDRIKQKASKNQIVLADNLDEVNASVVFGQDTLDVELKLISDYHSFKPGENWSYRIKFDDTNYQGVRVLNLYPIENINPKRFFINSLAKDLGVIVPRIGVISVQYQDKVQDYFWDEHFEKQLLESQHRREAPILKFDIRPYKELLVKEFQNKRQYDFPIFMKTSIMPFSKGKMLSDPNLKSQFIQASTLLENLRHGNFKELNHNVELASLANIYVLKDQFIQENNPILWYNLRYFYNSTNAKLEPILYGIDGITDDKRVFDSSQGYENKLKADASFQLAYSQAKDQLNGDFIKQKLVEYNESRNQYISYSNYTLDEMTWEAVMNKSETPIIDKVSFVEVNFYEPIPAMALKIVELGNMYRIKNNHLHAIEILGTGVESTILQNLRKTIQPNQEIMVDKRGHLIYYRVANRKTIYHASYIQYPILDQSIGQHLRESAELPKGFRLTGDSLIYMNEIKSHQSDIIIPAGYQVIFPEGSIIRLEGSSFLSFSPVYANGTADQPVMIYSKGAKGFTVIDAAKKSILTHTTFDKFGNQQFDGWMLPGAVTFNNSDVELSHCTFANNTCEDGLNIVNATFVVDQCLFENTFGDAFDADFCIGEITNSQYINIGNDAMDFSTSHITIRECTVNSCGDKGISSGENSNMDIRDVSISNAIIGIASKDLSQVKAEKVSLTNCERNFAVFRKKREYGPARIEVISSQIAPSKLENIIDKNSILILDGQEIIGDQPIDVDALYP